ncbi:hypothetical protein CJ030_MR0G027300, partial [Morella rubra]
LQQKIVIKLRVPCDKCSSKALALAAEADGVSSVALEGADRDQVVVIGDGVDAACLTTSLRKKVGCVLLVSVEEVKPKDAKGGGDKGKNGGDNKGKDGGDNGKKNGEDKKKDPPPPQCVWTMNPPNCHPHCEMYKIVYEDPYPQTCTIM